MCCAPCGYPHKMKSFLLAISLFIASSFAIAQTVPAKLLYNLTGSQYSASNAASFFSSAQAACDYVFTSSTHPSKLATQLVGNVCNLSYSTTSAVSEFPVYSIYACPAPLVQVGGGSPVASTMCTVPSCPAGQAYNSTLNSCASDCSILKDQRIDFSVNCSSTDAPSAVCFPNNCAGSVFSSETGKDKTKGCYFGTAHAKLTGSACTGEPSSSNFTNPQQQPTPPDDSPETKCIQKGMSYGVVNGVVMCLPKSSAGAQPITSKADSSKSTTTTDAQGNSTTDTSTKKSESTLSGGQVITKETTKNKDGSEKEETTTSTVGEFCAVNPNHQLCKKGTEEDTASACEENPDLPECLSLGEPDDTTIIPEVSHVVSFSPVSITSGGSCPADKTVSIAGRGITLSYSWICSYAAMFKPFMIAFAYLSAAMFLFWGFKGAQ